LLVENLKIQLIRPPVSIRVRLGPAGERTLAFGCHASLRACVVIAQATPTRETGKSILSMTLIEQIDQ
jgi:hypothetical protein